MVTTSTVTTVTGVTLLTGVIGYAAYFDYKRRNDPQFRSRLRKDAKRTQREQKRQTELRQKEAANFIERTVAEFGRPGSLPEDPAAREQIFSQQVSIGEMLAAQGPSQFLSAAAAFYKALKVYPSPNELLMIYRQAVPQEALDYIHQMVAMDPSMDQSSGGTDPFAALSQAAALAQQGGSRLEEVDDEGPQTGGPKPTSSTASREKVSPTGSATSSQEGSAPSVNSQEWEQVSKTAHGGDEEKITEIPAAPASAATDSVQQTGQDALDAATGASQTTAPAAPPVYQAQGP